MQSIKSLVWPVFIGCLISKTVFLTFSFNSFVFTLCLMVCRRPKTYTFFFCSLGCWRERKFCTSGSPGWRVSCYIWKAQRTVEAQWIFDEWVNIKDVPDSRAERAKGVQPCIKTVAKGLAQSPCWRVIPLPLSQLPFPPSEYNKGCNMLSRAPLVLTFLHFFLPSSLPLIHSFTVYWAPSIRQGLCQHGVSTGD